MRASRASDGMPDCQEYHRPDHRDQEAPEIEARHAANSGRGEDPAANHRADDAEQNVNGSPSPRLFTSLLAMKPAMSPNTIQRLLP